MTATLTGKHRDTERFEGLLGCGSETRIGLRRLACTEDI